MCAMKNNVETLEKIVESAIILFNKDGYAGASISNIATHAGVVKGNVYYYFKSKDELYLYCTKKCIEDFSKYISENIGCGDDNVHLAIELLKLRISFFDFNPNYRNLFLNIVAQKPDHLAKQLKEVRQEFKDGNLGLFMEYLSHIKLGKGVTTKDIRVFVSVLENYTSIVGEIFDETKAFDDECQSILKMATIFINGLKVDIQ